MGSTVSPFHRFEDGSQIIAANPAINDPSITDFYLDKEVEISVIAPKNVFKAKERFVYKPDPVLSKVHPLEALAR